MANTRFSQHFELEKSQADLEFVDIPLNTDIRLYVDPYAFAISNDNWYIECNNSIVGFFNSLIKCIRTGNNRIGLEMLGGCREPNETHLGQSTASPRGRGLGPEKGRVLYKSLSESEAAKTGFLEDLNDCELMIPGFGPDTISDISINIIRGHLVSFTQNQCKLHGIPSQRVRAGKIWNPAKSQWESHFSSLPVVADEPLLLVPRDAVRIESSVSAKKFEARAIDFLVQENLDAHTSLVRVLKNGERVVHKKTIKEEVIQKRIQQKELQGLKGFLFDFAREHPEVLVDYKREAIERSQPVPVDQLSIIVNNYSEVSVEMSGDNANFVGGDNMGGVVGSGQINAHDITAFKGHIEQSQISEDAREALLSARQEVEQLVISEGEKTDICDDIGKMTSELENAEPDSGRISTIFDRINKMASSVGAILKGIAAVASAIDV
ncbi:hypothetical protein [Stratiformator vulcanicus]|uniref:Uncharacterized protein n=1 Tax=Stratiformator vulcanicus TaxID=2527980 RepID=A0A517R1J6_9PLAN|nr:hypothetical protein [Stratiformator vulcanicus]QDT37713.1 hypothetical protein Pan189_20950 [Stratiformator vulcanicus]